MRANLTGFIAILSTITCKALGVGIIGGKPVQSFYPFFLKVNVDNFSCGGTLVTANAVVTAAHCLFITSKNRWAFPEEIHLIKGNFSDRNWPTTAPWYSCDRYVKHRFYRPNMNEGFNPFDIAVIKLTRTLDLMDPKNGILQFCDASTRYGEGFAIGLGLTQRRPDILPSTVMGVKLFELTHSACERALSKFGVIVHEELQLCFGRILREGPAGACKGDSGSPILHRDKISGQPLCIIGLNSFNSKFCDEFLFPSIFTRVASFKNWLKRTLLALE